LASTFGFATAGGLTSSPAIKVSVNIALSDNLRRSFIGAPDGLDTVFGP
jgi:hypothetical protein